jgi:hypothetical protein
MTTIFRTLVLDLPPTPLGLLPRRWKIEHRCTLCRSEVATQDLVAHAQAHTHNNPNRDRSEGQANSDA